MSCPSAGLGSRAARPLLFLVLTCVLLGAGSDTAFGTVEPRPSGAAAAGFGEGTIFGAPTVERIQPSQILRPPHEGDPRLVLFAAHHFSHGQLIDAAPNPGQGIPEGFLLKVVGSRVLARKTIVRVEAASLYEAVPRDTISSNLEDSSSAISQNHDARLLERAGDADASDLDGIPFSETASCKQGAEISLSGDLSPSLTPRFHLEWHRSLAGFPIRIDNARVTLDGRLEIDAKASISGSAGCSIGPVTLLEPKWTVIVPVGHVPLPVTVSIPITLQASATTAAGAGASAHLEGGGRLGVEYLEGGLKGIHHFDPPSASVKPDIKGNLNAEVTLGPAISIRAGWGVAALGKLAAGAKLSLASGLELTYDAARSPSPGELCAPLTATGSISLHLLRKTISPKPLTFLDTPLTCRKFGGEGQQQPAETKTTAADLRRTPGR